MRTHERASHTRPHYNTDTSRLPQGLKLPWHTGEDIQTSFVSEVVLLGKSLERAKKEPQPEIATCR